MKRIDAEKLLGGYATGTLTDAERQDLFAAALAHQAVFDALMDEEALRELLADPSARAQLLAALAPPEAAPKVVPFWRRTGVLGAAASLIVAATAGLAYLRNPDAGRAPAMQEQAPAPKAAPVPAGQPASPSAAEPSRPSEPRQEVGRTRAGQADRADRADRSGPAATNTAPGVAPIREATPPPAPPPPAAMAAGLVSDAALRDEAAREKTAEARDNLARKAEAPRPVPAVSGMIGGAAQAPVSEAEASPAAKKLKAARAGVSQEAVLPAEPAWTLEPLPDGLTRVTVIAPVRPQPLLLKRGAGGGVEVIRPQADPGARGAALAWVARVRLAAGDTLDLYLVDAPVPDPARLPETGPVDGYRARIHPPLKKGSGR